MTSDYYEILGVQPTATAEEIKARYRFLSHAYHPDKFGENEAHRKAAEEDFKRINEAYENLSNPLERAKFDAARQSTLRPAQQSRPTYEPPPGPYEHTYPRTSRRTEQPPPPTPATAALAKWSLGLGISGFLCFFLPAVPGV